MQNQTATQILRIFNDMKSYFIDTGKSVSEEQVCNECMRFKTQLDLRDYTMNVLVHYYPTEDVSVVTLTFAPGFQVEKIKEVQEILAAVNIFSTLNHWSIHPRNGEVSLTKTMVIANQWRFKNNFTSLFQEVFTDAYFHYPLIVENSHDIVTFRKKMEELLDKRDMLEWIRIRDLASSSKYLFNLFEQEKRIINNHSEEHVDVEKEDANDKH